MNGMLRHISSVFGNFNELNEKSPTWNQLETYIVESIRKTSGEAAGEYFLFIMDYCYLKI